MSRRIRFTDPAPLPPDAPLFADRKAAKFYAAEKRNATLKMREFDRQPEVVRMVEHAVGNVAIARRLVAQGVRTTEEAEPVVRELLAARWRNDVGANHG